MISRFFNNQVFSFPDSSNLQSSFVNIPFAQYNFHTYQSDFLVKFLGVMKLCCDTHDLSKLIQNQQVLLIEENEDF